MPLTTENFVAQWEEAIQNGLPVLDATEHILRNCWLIDLPVIVSVDDEEESIERAFAEVRVVALHWGSGPTSSADQMLVALPLHACS
eukprot:6489835-Amphidinium_carterae.1